MLVGQRDQPCVCNLSVTDNKDYAVGNYYDAQTAMTGRVLRQGTSNRLQLQPLPVAEDAPDDAQPSKQANVAALAHLTAWATQPTSTRWFAVLGELGMGKTYLCRMLECHLKADKTAPRAIYIDLKASADDAAANRALTLESIIGNSLRADYNQPKHITVDTVLDWVRKQGAIAIFDGLDELAVHLKDEGTRALITELLRVLPPRAEPAPVLDDAKTKKKIVRPAAPEKAGKAIISCRTHYFPDIASESAFLLQAHRGTMNQDDVESFTLLPFTEEAIRRFFTQALGAASADHAFELISEVHNLRELAERPYLLRLITSQIERLEDFRKRGQTVNAATLYGLFAADWLQRDTGKHEFDVVDKTTVMQALAAEMWREGARQWSHMRLKTWLYTLIERTPGWGFRYAAKADVLGKDLRTATFLVRIGESDFRFAHTSLQEYFLSGYLLDALLDGADSAATRWQALAPSNETVAFVWQRWQLLDAASQRRAIDTFRALLALRPSAASADKASATAPFSAWLKYLALQPDNPAAEINLAGIVDGDFVLVGSAQRPLRLPALTLDAAQLPGAQLTHVNAPRLQAIGSDLQQSRWVDADVSHAQFEGANLRGSYWQNVSMRDATTAGAAFDGALLQYCDFSGVALPLSSVRSSPAALLNPRSAFAQQGFRRIDVPDHLRAIIATGHSEQVTSVVFSPDGQTLASGSQDNTVKLWDAATGREKASLLGHKNPVWSVAFSPDGQTLASGSLDNTVKLWDVSTGREKANLAGHKNRVFSVAFSPDGQTVASGSRDDTTKLWDVSTGRERASLAGHKNSVFSVAFSPDGQTLASGSLDNTVKLWDVATGREKASLAGHKNSVRSVAYSPDGQTLASGSDDDRVKLWDAATGREKASLAGHRGAVWSVAFSADGQTLASGSRDATVKLWDVATGHEKVSLAGHANWVWSVAFSPDGQTLASGSRDATVKLWDVATGHEKASLAGHANWVWSVAFSPDGQTLASGSADKMVKLWDVATGREKARLTGHKKSVTSVAFNPDGQTLASGSDNNTVKLWDVATGREKASLVGHKNSVNSVAFSPDGQTLASGSLDNTVKLWDVATGRQKASLVGHKNSVNSVAFSPDGQTLASGSDDDTVKLWDIATAREKRSHINLPRGAWVVLDATADPSDEGGLPVVAASADAPEYLRQHWRNRATGELAWMPWVPPGTALWVKYERPSPQGALRATSGCK